MTPDDIKAAIELARESLHKGGAEYSECDLNTLARALLALAVERERMWKVVEAAEQWRESKYHGCRSFSGRVSPQDSPLVSAVDVYRCAALAASSQGGGA
jgi:hypothetical protein